MKRKIRPVDAGYVPVCFCSYLTQQVLRKFFSNFVLIFQYVSPLDPWIWDPKEKFFVSTGSMIFRCDPICPYGVRVTNFLNIANFDLIFLHNTHILYVCLFVGLFVILFCLSCQSVCLSV